MLYRIFRGPGEESTDIAISLEEGHPYPEQVIELIKEDKVETDPVPLGLRDKLRSGHGITPWIVDDTKTTRETMR